MLKSNEAIWDCHYKTKYRLKRQLMTTTGHEHGRPAETKPVLTIFIHVLMIEWTK